MPNSDPSVTFRELTELSDLVVTGELSLQDVGRIVTSTDTGSPRVIISSTAVDKILFPTGDSTETYHAAITSVPAAGAASGRLTLNSPMVGTDYSEIDMASTYVKIYKPVVLNDDLTGYGSINGAVLTADDYVTSPSYRGVSPSTFDPALSVVTGTTLPSVGTGANALQSGIYTQMGPQVIGHFTLRWSSNGSSGNGTYCINLPKKPATSLPLNPSLGSGRIFTSTGSREWLCDIRYNSSMRAIFRMGTTVGLNVTDGVPAIWVNSSNNRITGLLSYLTTE